MVHVGLPCPPQIADEIFVRRSGCGFDVHEEFLLAGSDRLGSSSLSARRIEPFPVRFHLREYLPGLLQLGYVICQAAVRQAQRLDDPVEMYAWVFLDVLQYLRSCLPRLVKSVHMLMPRSGGMPSDLTKQRRVVPFSRMSGVFDIYISLLAEVSVRTFCQYIVRKRKTVLNMLDLSLKSNLNCFVFGFIMFPF